MVDVRSDDKDKVNADLSKTEGVSRQSEAKSAIQTNQNEDKTRSSIDDFISKTFASSRDMALAQLGIEIGISQLPKAINRNILITDFMVFQEITFEGMDRFQVSPDHNFRIYAPFAFEFYRTMCGITKENFRESICSKSVHKILTFSHSGDVLYSTFDNRFIIKTCHKKEAMFLKKMLPRYFLNLTRRRETLLPRFFGLYSFRRRKVLYGFIMNNLLPNIKGLHEIYDLKGATYYRRRSKYNKMYSKCSTSPNSTRLLYKDLDFLDNWPDGFYFNEDAYSLLIKSLEKDCDILRSYDIMDYSLLLGIHLPFMHPNRKSPTPYEERESFKSLSGPFTARTMKGEIVHLYMGIIDILQSYTLKKKIEYCFKSCIFSGKTISVNNPDFYAQRFQNFLKTSVFKCIPELNLLSYERYFKIKENSCEEEFHYHYNMYHQ